jgi:hypothetical protein
MRQVANSGGHNQFGKLGQQDDIGIRTLKVHQCYLFCGEQTPDHRRDSVANDKLRFQLPGL